MAAEETTRSGWSLGLGSVAGIPIRVHFTFLLLLVWFALRSRQQGHDPALAVVFLLLVFGCVVLHELGHALTARRFGVRTREIVLYPIGGLARLESIPSAKAELWIALAGPAVNLVLFLILAPLAAVRVLAVGAIELSSAADLVVLLAVANLVLFGFNLVPAFPMDGGRVLRAALSLHVGPERATEIAASVGQGAAILFGAFGILTQQILWVLIALFVFLGASQEALLHRQIAVVRGRRAREAMITRFETLAPQDALSVAAEKLLATHQHDFPVIDAWNRLVGVLPRARLLEAMARQGPEAATLEVMVRDVTVVGPEESLDRVLELLRAQPHSPVLVTDGGRVAGMITLENLTEFIEITRSGSRAVS